MIITPPCDVISPTLAAGSLPIKTFDDPFTITSGGPTHVQVSVTLAAGIAPMITVGYPVTIGPPAWGTGGNPGVANGQVCISVMRAAGSPTNYLFLDLLISIYCLKIPSFAISIGKSSQTPTLKYFTAKVTDCPVSRISSNTAGNSSFADLPEPCVSMLIGLSVTIARSN